MRCPPWLVLSIILWAVLGDAVPWNTPLGPAGLSQQSQEHIAQLLQFFEEIQVNSYSEKQRVQTMKVAVCV